MPGLALIVGQARAVDVLRHAIAEKRVHHAYLFEGPDGVGKATTARALAMALNCENNDPDGCGNCGACLKIESGAHPDVVSFDMTPKGLTERVRELVGLCGFRPHEGRARVVILDPAGDLAGPQEMSQPANVLLKTLEEPPAGTHFVLCTAEPRRLPITVRSRCQRVRFGALDEATSARLRGDDELTAAIRPQVEALLTAARRGEPRSIFDAAAEVGGDREQALAACTLLWSTLRDALLLREQLHRGRVPPERADFAAQWLGDRPSSSLLAALRATSETSLALRGNVAPQLALEHLVLQLAPAQRPA